MLPSDHFVRMYNELFKMLEERGEEELKAYWLEISDLQESLVGPYIANHGLRGMYEYWDKIRVEENCEMDLSVTDRYFEIVMHRCPSLSKNLDNDAGQSIRYCDHCAGWINPLIRNHGYFPVYDIKSRTKPVCQLRVYTTEKEAREFADTAELLWEPYKDE